MYMYILLLMCSFIHETGECNARTDRQTAL